VKNKKPKLLSKVLT